MIRKSGLFAVLLALLASAPSQAAEEGTVQAVIPWEAKGRIFRVDTAKMMYLGALTGILYVESTEGEINEAFVMCPVTQTIDIEEETSNATARCEITASGVDIAYAKLTCEGDGDDCKGTFEFVSGEGRFAGIKGKGTLRVRSPIDVLVEDMASGAELGISAGLMIIKNLEYRIPKRQRQPEVIPCNACNSSSSPPYSCCPCFPTSRSARARCAAAGTSSPPACAMAQRSTRY